MYLLDLQNKSFINKNTQEIEHLATTEGFLSGGLAIH
jgi:hypothetical protein